MKMINYLFGVTLMALSIGLSGCSHVRQNNDTLFQTSTINALLQGVYDGDITFQELKRHGDFGLGTINALDGEMIGLNGKFYQVKTDGIAYPINDSMKTPFANVTFFKADKSVVLDKPINNYGQLKGYLDDLLPTKNIFYAIKIEGVFTYIKTRSVPRQNKPYPLLVEVVKNQSTFEFQNVRGTMVGFRCPDYVAGVNVPGYHFHFITKDRKAGGHMFECKLQHAKIKVDYISGFDMLLPHSTDFYKINLTSGKPKELDKVEK